MPSIPYGATSSQQPQVRPPDPNVLPQHGHNSHEISQPPSHQPSPGIIDTASHTALHVLPRRFLGPLPVDSHTSKSSLIKRSRIHRARQKALERIHGVVDIHKAHGAGAFESEDEGVVRRQLKKIKVLRKVGGVNIQEELDLREDDWDEEEGGLKKHKKGYGWGLSGMRGREKWEGESFDIGREFFIPKRPSPSHEDSQHSASSLRMGGVIEGAKPLDQELDLEPSETQLRPSSNETGPSQSASSTHRKRPNLTTKSTQESFVTARTEFSTPSTSTIDLPQTFNSRDGIGQSPAKSQSNGSLPYLDTTNRHSGASSTRPLLDGIRPLVTSPLDGGDQFNHLGKNRLQRLKSAIRKPSSVITSPPQVDNLDCQEPSDIRDNGGRNADAKIKHRPKNVSFPMNPANYMNGEDISETPGNKPPEDPQAVLAREGQDAEGTSAGAQEAAMEEEEEEWDEEGLSVGDAVLRDRMLVKVGYHHDDGISLFDEQKQRRSPCARMETFEEYIAVLRKGRIELYQDYRNPIIASIRKHLRLCFVVPLLPSHTSLSVFNTVDMSISLATSASKLRRDMEDPIKRANTTRAQAMKQRVKESKQAQWLSRTERGTHIFILKLGERSRAMDWYWKIWRDIDGQLPEKFDISVPALSTSVRIKIPEDRFDTGGIKTQKELTPEKVVGICWDMLQDVVDVHDLMRQAKQGNDKFASELAWKNIDGSLEWIAYSTTVEGRPRPWAVLAGVAKLPSERVPRTLQLRGARHGPSSLKLETGTLLEEPPGVEGYLTRHKTGNAPKEAVYVASHDGVIYSSSLSKARPPLPPGREGIYPHDVFPEVHEEFMDGEKKRMARFIERSAGCVDIRSIKSVCLCSESETTDALALTKQKKERSFVVTVEKGTSIFEAASYEVAKEWVERLQALMEYWKRRHRVDARLRMDAMALHKQNDPFAGTHLSNQSDDILSDIWDWCAIQGCRSICLAGRLYFKKKPLDKFKARYIVLTGGNIVTFKVKTKQSYYPRQHHYPLFGAYVYSGMLAQDELPEVRDENALGARARVYQDGLQSSDGAEDTTFCIRLIRGKSGWRKQTYPWEEENADDGATLRDNISTINTLNSVPKTVTGSKENRRGKSKHSRFFVPPLSDHPPQLLVFRARSKLERDRWVWAINAEMERQVRANTEAEARLRNYGVVP